MSDGLAASLDSVEARIGHKFGDRTWLETALTHPSAAASGRVDGDYQRLEFLGDRVLGLVVADMLLEAFPDADEGELHRRHANLVRKETCADVASDLRLDDALIVSGGQSQRKTLVTRNVLGDICESVIAAIYLDAGTGAARDFILQHWRERMLGGTAGRRNAKTELQEWAHARGFAEPDYAIIERSGPDHEPHFVVEVAVGSLAAARGEGASKRKAEQAAALVLLEREGVGVSAE